MRFTGQVRIEASPEQVWNVFMDPDALCRITPACQEAHRVDERRYAATIATRMKLIPVEAAVRGELLDAREPEQMLIGIAGETTNLPGSFHARLALDLRSDGAATAVSYTLEGAMLGRIGTLGEPLLRSTVQKVAEKFAANASAYLSQTSTTGHPGHDVG